MVSLRNERRISFQHVNRIILHYNSETFEANCSDYNSDELKALLSPLGEHPDALFHANIFGLTPYTDIDYFIDERLVFLSNYNRNILPRLMTRTTPIGRFSSNEFDIYRVLELLSYE